MVISDFEEYLRQGEPSSQDKINAWQTAIGLQSVDGLSPSQYLLDTARKHIDGDISIDEARDLIKSYYQSKSSRDLKFSETEEADKASANIAKILGENTFSFSLVGLLSIHQSIFDGIFKFSGKIRDYNITKKEWGGCVATLFCTFLLLISKHLLNTIWIKKKNLSFQDFL